MAAICEAKVWRDKEYYEYCGKKASYFYKPIAVGGQYLCHIHARRMLGSPNLKKLER